MPLELTQKQMSEEFGVTTRQIRNWEADGLACRAEGNRKLYPLAHAIRFYADRFAEKAAAAAGTRELDAIRARKLRAEAEVKEIELARLRGELVPMSEVDGLLRDALEAIDSVIRSVPGRFAARLAKASGAKLSRAKRVLADSMELVRGAIRDRAAPDDETSDVA